MSICQNIPELVELAPCGVDPVGNFNNRASAKISGDFSAEVHVCFFNISENLNHVAVNINIGNVCFTGGCNDSGLLSVELQSNVCQNCFFFILSNMCTSSCHVVAYNIKSAYPMFVKLAGAPM